jgi:uncharacterized membrane protein YjdF
MRKVIARFNILLVIIAVIGSYYYVFTRDNQLGLILKDASILITITLPYIIEKIFKTKISIVIKTTYIVFIFIAQFLGVTVELYNHISWFDKFTHWLSGIITALLSLSLLSKFKLYNKKNVLFNIIWMISITLAIASLWECFEYCANILFGGDAQRVATTGVNDTMQDIIVAFIGSIIVSLIYSFECKTDNNGIVNSFIY